MLSSLKKITLVIWVSTTLCFSTHALTNVLKVKLIGSSYSDEGVIRFLSNATTGFDGSYDAYKMFSTNPLVPSLFTNIDSVSHLSINALPSLISQTDVELFTYVKTTGIYSIQSIELGAFAIGVSIVLEDKQTGKFYNFRNGNSVSVLINTNTIKTANRFIIHFSPPMSIITSNVTYTGLKNGNITLTKAGNHNWNCELKDCKGNIVCSNFNINETITILGLSAETYTLYSNSNYTISDTNSITITQPEVTTQTKSILIPESLNAYQQGNIIVLNIETQIPSNIIINIYNSLGSQVYSYSNNQISSLLENIELTISGNYFINSSVNNIARTQKITYIK